MPGTISKSVSIASMKSNVIAAQESGAMSKVVSDAIINNLDDVTLAATTNGVAVGDLDTTEVNIVLVINDGSGSMDDHEQEVKESNWAIAQDLQNYKQSDTMLMTCWYFNEDKNLVFACKPVSQVKKSDFDGYHPDGMTALYDTVQAAMSATRAYAQDLLDEGYAVRIFVVVMTDGVDNRSKISPRKVQDLAKAMMQEEIAVLSLVAFKESVMQYSGQDIAKALGFPNLLEFDPNDAGGVREQIKKATKFVSKSVIRASQMTVANAQNTFFTP